MSTLIRSGSLCSWAARRAEALRANRESFVDEATHTPATATTTATTTTINQIIK